MKKPLFLILGLNLCMITNAFAADNPAGKLGRGIVNVVTAPIEIPREVRAHWIAGTEKTYHVVPWIFCGLIKGMVLTGARIGSGAWDIVTFPIKVPADYKSVLRPEYVFDNWPVRKEGVVYKNFGEK